MFPELSKPRHTNTVERIVKGNKWHKEYSDALWDLSTDCTFSSEDVVIVRPSSKYVVPQPYNEIYEYQWLIIIRYEDGRDPLAIWDIDFSDTFEECQHNLEANLRHPQEGRIYESYIAIQPRSTKKFPCF